MTATIRVACQESLLKGWAHNLVVDRALGLELHLVLRECARLIGTEDSHAGHIFYGGQPRHDRPYYRRRTSSGHWIYIRYISDDLPCFDSSFEPRASVVVVTISIASGIEATMSTTVNESASTT